MSELFPRRAFGAVVVALALVVVACGGAASPAPSAGPSAPAATAAPTPSPTPEATATAEPTPTVEPTASAEPSGTPVIDIGSLTGNVSELTAYQIDLRMSGYGGLGEIVISQKYQTQPVNAQAFDVDMAGQQTSMIIIEGQGAWSKVGGSWVELPGDPSQYTESFAALAPDVLVEQMNLDQFGAALFLKGEEQRNGVATLHYAIDASKLGLLPAAASIPPDANVEIWVAKDGNYLVAMEFSGTFDQEGLSGKIQMTLDVSHVNDASLKITAPK